MSSRVLRVFPPSRNGDSNEQPGVVLSDMDHILHGIYVLLVEVFRLSNDADQDAIVDNMRKGLEYTLSQYPAVAGSLQRDKETGRLAVEINMRDSVSMHIVHAETELPSYAQLEKRHFPVAELDANKLLPKLVTTNELLLSPLEGADEKQPIAVVQLNFIHGGLILGAALHHNFCDGYGADAFLSVWAENARAAAAGSPTPPGDPAYMERTRLTAIHRPDGLRFKTLSDGISTWKIVPRAPLPAEFKLPALSSRMWHFPTSKLALLKAAASAKPGLLDNGGDDFAGSWISTFDAVLAFVWQRVTVAKLPFLKPDLDAHSIVAHTVNTRTRMSPPLADRFMGNAVAIARAEPLPIRDVIDPANLSRLARLVRQATNAITPQALDELAEWISGVDDPRNIQLNLHSFLGMDFLANSWHQMRAYAEHDFGFGLPRALRWPSPAFDGYVCIFPSRAHIVGGDEGLEMAICLEEQTAKRLMVDEIMLQYASPRF
ncbi:Omega-hydroxypalmitate O-feruloyl transferase [Mycena chlorophos]|uniref:Omega-hydroxypalmitate O-feruloyl transferase n=1 Tax=Mycena chlorophos TaxID=658473 RepID=A0A8H6S264_MYCCL|nr:Omega-hydroxypalmitate O-feruloyl transferase [Mycena chlorophos]